MVKNKAGTRFIFTCWVLKILRALVEWSARTEVDLVITSGCEGRHVTGSKHYRGEALDVRTKTLSLGQKEQLAVYLRTQLGLASYVALEQAGTANEHMHVELN